MLLTKNEFKKECADDIITALEDGYSGYLCDLHNEVFNTSKYFTSKTAALQWAKNYEENAFEIISAVVNYEQFNFGEIYTEISNPAKVINAYRYVMGEEVLGELMEDSPECDELWNEEIGETERKVLIKIFSERAEELYC